MSETVVLTAEPRERAGKGYARRARLQGRLPGVLYGPSVDNLALELDRTVLERLVAAGGAGQLVELHVGEAKHTVLIKEVQKDPVRGTVLHVDLHQVPLDKELETTVSVVLEGESERENDGGILTQSLRDLQVACLPHSIPESITVNVSGLKLGDSLQVGALELPEGVRAVTDAESVVVAIVAPRLATEDEEAEGEGDEAAEAAEEASPGEADGEGEAE